MDIIAVDIETTVRGDRSSPYLDDILLIQVNFGDRIEVSTKVEDFEDVLGDPSVLKVFQNGCFDIGFLECWSFDLDIRNIWDTMIVERLLTAGTSQRSDLGTIVEKYCDVVLDKEVRKTFAAHAGALTATQLEYAENDVRYLIEVYKCQLEEIKSRDMTRVADLENTLVPIVAEMELLGIGFDPKAWESMLQTEGNRLPELELQVQQQLSETFTMDLFSGVQGTINLNSPTQLLRAFRRAGVDIEDTSEDTMKKCSHPAAKMLLEYRECAKRLQWDYPSYVNPKTGRIHPDYKQVGARTGRFSCTSPNLQNVPREQRFRNMFVAREGRKMITADYSQQELRVLAQYCQDPALIETCTSEDPHLKNARLIYKDETIQKSDERRRTAKNTNFALMYGAGAKTFANAAGISLSDARVFLKELKRLYPGAFTWGHKSWQFLVQNGYTTTLLGRRRYFPEVMNDPGKYATVARNTPIQGSSADMMKSAMIEVTEKLRNYDANLLLCVHDELVVEAATSQADEVSKVVEESMRVAGEKYVQVVPIKADATIADTWTK